MISPLFQPKSLLINAGVLSVWLSATVLVSGAYSADEALPVEALLQQASPQVINQSLQGVDNGLMPSVTVASPVKAKAVAVDIVSNTLDYDTAANLYTATGQVKVVVSEQNTELWGDKVVYDPGREVMTAFGNVVINNKGQKVYGTYAKIDLTRQSALINDPITALDEVRIKARQAFVDGKVSRMFNGKLVVVPKAQPTATALVTPWAGESDPDLSQLAITDPLRPLPSKKPASTASAPVDPSRYPNTLVPQDLDMSWDQDHAGVSNNMQYYAKHVDVIRGEDGYDEINAISPVLKYKNYPIARLNQMDFAHVGPTADLEYLGPDIGVDPDYGGFYVGPGWDFRLGKGFLRTSPFLILGVGQRRRRSGQDIDDVSGVGGGLMTHYLSNRMNISAGYNVLVGTPTLLLNRKMFGDGKTRLLLTANEDYTMGFFGFERPRYSAQLTDRRFWADEALRSKNIRLETYATAGVAHDEFFPTNQEDYFIEKPDKKPVTAGRFQLQTQLRNARPVWSVGRNDGDHLQLGWQVQGSMSGYTTGDYYGLLRFGPTARINLFNNRFTSINRYFYSLNSGETPFVFDGYTAGRNSLLTRNQFQINKFLAVGMRTQFSLNSDNARGDMITGNQLYVLFGPEDVKFNLAYDHIRQRTFFGINLMQGKAHKTLHYERMDVYQPQDYDGAPPQTTSAAPPPPATMAHPATDIFGNVQDVGLMNGSASR
ncbi:MAG: hypothetical protein U0003_02630 [Vampirovibrionales bacterium]